MAAVDPSLAFNKPKCFGLNIDDKHPFANLLSGAGLTKSDSDEQLILSFHFNETTALSGFQIESPQPESAPRDVQVFLNQVNFSFDDVESAPVAASFSIKSPGEVCALKQVTFNRVNSITLFVQSNQSGSECTVLSGVKFFGKSLGGTDVSQLKKQREDGDE